MMQRWCPVCCQMRRYSILDARAAYRCGHCGFTMTRVFLETKRRGWRGVAEAWAEMKRAKEVHA
jgi:hypothetical protein